MPVTAEGQDVSIGQEHVVMVPVISQPFIARYKGAPRPGLMVKAGQVIVHEGIQKKLIGEFVGVAIFLASEEAEHVRGQIIEMEWAGPSSNDSGRQQRAGSKE